MINQYLKKIFDSFIRFLDLIKFILTHSFYTSIRKPLIMNFFHKKYIRSRNRIEIDLTYECQLKCFNCNRSCRQAPADEIMTIAQVEKFIKESIENSYKWERIRLLGGEPTLHPEILLILDLMSKYRRDHSPETIIQLVTNGFGSSSEILRKVPQNIEVCNSKKKSRNQLFSSFNLAPVDKKNYKPGNYEKGCINFSECGIGLNRYGYYCCGNAAGIDRVFGFDFGRKKLPLPDDQFEDQLKTFCKLCGIFASFRLTKRELISASWQKAYRRYSEKRPQLKLY